MKNYKIKLLSVIVFFLVPVILSLAQPLPGDPAYYNTPSGNGLPGGGAPTMNCPVGNGYWVLLALTFVYGAYKTWQIHNVKKRDLF
jgi:hypothetical protein